jgi:hypothetical protein
MSALRARAKARCAPPCGIGGAGRLPRFGCRTACSALSGADDNYHEGVGSISACHSNHGRFEASSAGISPAGLGRLNR